MTVTGYKIRSALKRLEQRRAVLVKQFKDALHVFSGQDKADPRELVTQLRESERKIAALQVLQAHYNLAVQVTVRDEPMSLHDAVKRVGGAGRIESLWREAATAEPNPWGYNPLARSTEQEYAEEAIPPAEALAEAERAASLADSYREAIAVGNANEMEFEGLDPSLFE